MSQSRIRIFLAPAAYSTIEREFDVWQQNKDRCHRFERGCVFRFKPVSSPHLFVFAQFPGVQPKFCTCGCCLMQLMQLQIWSCPAEQLVWHTCAALAATAALLKKQKPEEVPLSAWWPGGRTMAMPLPASPLSHRQGHHWTTQFQTHIRPQMFSRLSKANARAV